MVKEIKSQEEFDTVMHSDDANNVSWCPRCGRAYVIDWTDAERKAMLKWSSGKMLIQKALPNRSENERELMRYAWNGSPMIACSDECLKEQYRDDEISYPDEIGE